MLTENDDAGRSCVYIINESKPEPAGVHLVFADKEALSAVRFRSFVRDCRSMERPATELVDILNREKRLLSRFIEKQFSEVIRASRPNVVRFRERLMVAIFSQHAESA